MKLLGSIEETNTLLANAEVGDHPPVVMFITGSSGCGKTFLAQALETRLNSDRSAVRYFDRVGIPSLDQMILDFGSPEKWQEATTHRWVESIANLRDKALVVFEGQYHPRFALEAIRSVTLPDYVLAVVTADQEVWEERLRGPRGQPGLITDDMRNWARFLRDETSRLGGAVIDTSAANLEKNLDEIAALINPLLRRRIRGYRSNPRYGPEAHCW